MIEIDFIKMIDWMKIFQSLYLSVSYYTDIIKLWGKKDVLSRNNFATTFVMWKSRYDCRRSKKGI